MNMQILPGGPLKGEITIPGDKSISHRAVMFGAISRGDTEITGFLESADCCSTISCFEKMGVGIERDRDQVIVHGRGLHGLKEPGAVLDAGNSGTTTRLMSGILAGQPFTSVIDGDDSLRKRPMKRIMDPLTQMGASLESIGDDNCLPLKIRGGSLHGISFCSPVASAQVKSCILLAGLYASGVTSVTEPSLSRDHTERMLRSFGADVQSSGTTCVISPAKELSGTKIHVPGDISSAAYWIAAGLLVPNSEVLIRNVGINPTRAGIIRAALSMGADLTCIDVRDEGSEPVADILVRTSRLKGTGIGGDIIPALIDELPVIAVMAAFAEGVTVIRDAGELRVKESDRISLMTKNLRAMGADVEEMDEGMIIHGGKPLHEAAIETGTDHRIAMSMAVAAQGAGCAVTLDDGGCIGISYPAFFEDMKTLQQDR